MCAAYFAWILDGPKLVRDRIAAGFAIVALIALPFNVRDGYSWRTQYLAGMEGFERDLASGLSLQTLAQKYSEKSPFSIHLVI